MHNMQDFMKALSILSEQGHEEIIKEILKNSRPISKNMPGVELLQKAQSTIVSSHRQEAYNNKPYLNTTENQKYFDTTLPQDTQNACVILGAGDTVLELVSRGVNKITAIDTNELQTLPYFLKKAAVQTLSAKEYENFLLNPHSHQFLSKQVFKRVEEGFTPSEEAPKNIWYHLFDLNPREDIIHHLFKDADRNPSKTKFGLPYLSKKTAYYELRSKLEQAQITIHNLSAIDHLQNTEETFDYIDITNILLFIYQLEFDRDMSEYLNFLATLKEIYLRRLNPGGTMVFDYWFSITPSTVATYQAKNSNQEFTRNLYVQTYQKLEELFDLQTTNVTPLIPGVSTEPDTVLFTKKM